MTPRRKMITTGALWSEKLASIDHAAERLYWRIYMASDNYGVLSGKAWDVCQKAVPGVAGYNTRTVEKALTALSAIGLLEIWHEPDGSTWAYVIGHDTHQAADFLRKRGTRRTPTPPSHLAPDELTESRIIIADAVPCPKAANGSEGQAVVALPTTTTTPTGSNTSSDKMDEKIREVFEYHTDKVWTGRGLRPMLDAKKARRIRDRLQEGATVADMKACVDGFLTSEWHVNSPERRYLAVHTVFRDREQIEKGVGLAVANENGAASTASNGVPVDQFLRSMGYGGAA